MSGGLPDRTHVGAVHLQVADLSRSVDYYQETLGLRLLQRAGKGATLQAGSDDPPLLHLEERPGARPVPRRGAYGLYHFAVLLPDRAALGRFALHAARRRLQLGMADHLVSESLYLQDPDGLGIEVYADRPRGTWRRRGEELVMATDPLDVESLVAEAGGERWEAAPPGTSMGHVHLHVGDLQEADRFYRAALGLHLTVWSYPGALFFAAGGYHHHLGTNTWSPGPAAAEDQARLLHWELVLPRGDEVEAAADRLRAAGYRVDPAPEGVATADPWGTALRLVGDRHQ